MFTLTRHKIQQNFFFQLLQLVFENSIGHSNSTLIVVNMFLYVKYLTSLQSNDSFVFFCMLETNNNIFLPLKYLVALKKVDFGHEKSVNQC